MARELGDVLHYFIDEPVARRGSSAVPEHGSRGAPAERAGSAPSRAPRGEPALVHGHTGETLQPARPVLAVPVGERDVVRSSLAWNLAVELARAGHHATLVAPECRGRDLPWPDSGPAPLGAQLVSTFADDLTTLATTVADVSAAGVGPGREGMVLARFPAEWLDEPSSAAPLLRWTLLFATPDAQDLEIAFVLIQGLLQRSPASRVGVTLHGVRSIEEAREAFLTLAARCERAGSRPLLSYGLLVDDLDFYRAIVERRPIGLARPQSRAARALGDVARLLWEDAAAGRC